MSGFNKNKQTLLQDWWSRIHGLFNHTVPTKDSLLKLLRDERWSKIISTDEMTMLSGVL